MNSLYREDKRVCYIESKPEWFSYAVVRLFYRNSSWLFVPVQDFTKEERIAEYKKSTYFFVSGYGHKEEASRAYKEGCVLVGVRADVDVSIPMIECGEWDAFGVYASLRFKKYTRVVPLFIFVITSRIFFIFVFAFKIFKADNWETIFIKLKKFLNI